MPKSIISFKQKGSFRNTDRFFHRSLKREYLDVLKKYGEIGVDLLREATPKDSGVTADSWSYRIEEGDGTVQVAWYNSNNNDWANVVLMIVYGHALQNGSYIEGNDFISPTLHPMFQRLADKAWREVTK